MLTLSLNIPKIPSEILDLISNKPAPLKKTLGNPLGAPIQKTINGIPVNTLAPKEPVDVKNVDLADARALCCCLSQARLDNRQDWINLGLCLKRIGAPCSLWDEVSKRSKKYKPNECEQLWCCMKPKSLGIGSLILWAKRDNLELYDRIKPTLKMIGNIFEDDQKHESVDIKCHGTGNTPRTSKPSKTS